MEIREAFGLHLTLDGYECDRDRLVDQEHIFDFLDLMPGNIGMTKIMPPYVFPYRGKVPEDWGVSGFVLIAESHISIHTFPERNYLSLDIFSCKNFDLNLALAHTVGAFGIGRHESNVLNRGLEFPHIPVLVRQHLVTERESQGGSGSGRLAGRVR